MLRKSEFRPKMFYNIAIWTKKLRKFLPKTDKFLNNFLLKIFNNIVIWTKHWTKWPNNFAKNWQIWIIFCLKSFITLPFCAMNGQIWTFFCLKRFYNIDTGIVTPPVQPAVIKSGSEFFPENSGFVRSDFFDRFQFRRISSQFGCDLGPIT